MSTLAQTRLSNATLLRAGGAAVLAAVVANVVTRLLLGAVVPLSPDFMPFTPGPIIAFTLLFTLIASVCWQWSIASLLTRSEPIISSASSRSSCR